MHDTQRVQISQKQDERFLVASEKQQKGYIAIAFFVDSIPQNKFWKATFLIKFGGATHSHQLLKVLFVNSSAQNRNKMSLGYGCGTCVSQVLTLQDSGLAYVVIKSTWIYISTIYISTYGYIYIYIYIYIYTKIKKPKTRCVRVNINCDNSV